MNGQKLTNAQKQKNWRFKKQQQLITMSKRIQDLTEELMYWEKVAYHYKFAFEKLTEQLAQKQGEINENTNL